MTADADLRLKEQAHDIGFVPAHALAGMIQRREISSAEIVDTYLQRIEQHNPSVHAIVTLDAEGAQRRAREADAALSHGEVWGPLHGVPLTLEDCHPTAGLRSTWGGLPRLADHVPADDGTVVARLKGAGAVLLGKTNGPTIWPDAIFPLPNNPWNLERSPGGSSAGPAVALAAGLTALDVGADTAGSIQNPAHSCGVYGMRPTEHRVPLTGMFFVDAVRKFRVMSVAGPMARSMEDLRLALRLISGPDGLDPHVPPVGWQDTEPPNPSMLRVAWAPAVPQTDTHAQIAQSVASFAQDLEACGAVVEEAFPRVDVAEQHQIASDLFMLLGHTFSDGAQPQSLDAYLALLQRRETIMAEWDRFFQSWDALLLPAGTDTVGERGVEVTTSWGYPYALSNVSGCPMIVLPAGVDWEGLPFGIQLLARRWQDARLLSIAQVVADLTPGFRRPPGF